MKKLIIATLAVALAGVGINSHAGTANDGFTVGATVIAACTITAGDLSFSNIDVRTAPVLQTNTIDVVCTKDSAYVIGLGAGVSGDVAARTMKDGSKVLNYFLYSDSGRTINWTDDLTGSAGGVGGTGSGVSQTITVYGRVPVQTNAVVGTYSDTVTATISF
jgi:spore coat protein U-like protein